MLKKLLFVNACINREKSRTDRLARALLSFYKDYDIEELILENMHLTPMDSKTLAERDQLLRSGSLNDLMFDLAHRFADADVVVVASPYWENMFNSMLHIFIENVAVLGIVFRYTEEGVPIGLCHAKTFYYVTTRGGPIPDEADMGYGIYSSLAHMYGIGNCIPVSAQALDIKGNDPDLILTEVIGKLPDIIDSE